MMGAVEILLLWVVGFSVLAFLFAQNLEDTDKDSSHEQGEEQTCLCDMEKAERQDFSQHNSEIQETHEAKPENRLNSVEISAENDKYSIFMRTEDGCEEAEEDLLDDDWEGIERTELEEEFGKGVVFLNSLSKGNADQIDEELRLQLYGLQKIVLEGPCHGSQPMALKVSARAKWNAWQKLGNISREVAMEKYISILSEAIPDWKGEGGEAIHDAETAVGLTSNPQNRHGVETEP